jgi:hypothetical protein
MDATATVETLARLTELRQENERLSRAKALRQSYGINFYVPHAKQDKFHTAGDKTGRYCRTGNRGGKTKCGAAEDVSWCLGGRVFYRNSFDVVDGKQNVVRRHVGGLNDPLVTKGIPQFPVKGLLVVADWDKAKDIFTNRDGSYETWGELFQLIPREALGKVHLSRGGHVDQINIKRLTEFGGGESTLMIDTVESFKHSKMSQESSDFDFLHYDEPAPRNMFVANSRGLVDRRGKYWFNCTPIDEMWINDLFSPPGQHVVKSADAGLEFGTKFIITWSIYDNPYNTPEGIAEFESNLTREEKACRLDGLPLAFAGLVYKEFIYDLHVLCDVPVGWEDYHLPPKDHTIRVAWDVHQRIPQAVLLTATAPNGEVFVYDELFFDSLVTPTALSLKEKVKGRFVCDYWIDPFAVIPSAVTNESVLDELAKHDLYFDKGSKDLDLGVSKVREKLLERTTGKMPTIWFSPKLQELLFEFTHYVYDVEKNKPKDKDDHMLENLRRLVLGGLEYIAPPSNAPRKSKPFVIRDNADLSFRQPTSLLK